MEVQNQHGGLLSPTGLQTAAMSAPGAGYLQAQQQPGALPASAPQAAQGGGVAAPTDPAAQQLQQHPADIPKFGLAKLVILNGNVPEFYVRKYEIVLGRNSKSSPVDVVLGDNMNISRQHAKIVYNFQQQCFELVVLSKNGVSVNGVLYTPGSPPPALKSQDVLSVSEADFCFLLPKQGATLPGTPLQRKRLEGGVRRGAEENAPPHAGIDWSSTSQLDAEAQQRRVHPAPALGGAPAYGQSIPMPLGASRGQQQQQPASMVLQMQPQAHAHAGATHVHNLDARQPEDKLALQQHQQLQQLRMLEAQRQQQQQQAIQQQLLLQAQFLQAQQKQQAMQQ